jgi:CheY-like chemotaxis protein
MGPERGDGAVSECGLTAPSSWLPDGDAAGSRVRHVLLVEDDPGDVLLAREAFEQSPLPCCLHVASDGEVALGFVRRSGPYADAPRPALILLDLNLPGLSGLEVLAELKDDKDLRIIPVVILTTSEAPEDILRSFRLHANAYITKPPGFEPFTAAIHQASGFFLGLSRQPA